LWQFNADFSYKRSSKESLYLALYILSNKRTAPKFLLRKIEKTPWFHRHPKPVIALAILSNIGKIFVEGIKLMLKGELSMHLVRRWLKNQSPFSLPSV